MSNTISKHNLHIDQALYNLVNDEIAPGTGVAGDDFWQALSELVADLAPRNHALLKRRDELQAQLNDWFKQNGGADIAAQKQFLLDIGYLLPEGDDFSVTVDNVDPEIAELAGPQLVVPVQNARFALNAANARWGSLYDALYGTDVIADDGTGSGGGYNPARGAKVIAYAKQFLDDYVPLAGGSYSDVDQLSLADGKLVASTPESRLSLADDQQLVGYTGDATQPASIVLRNHGLHIEIQIDAEHAIGKDDPANIKDVVLESALTTIQDFEDSVAAVDAADKVEVYRNWLGLIKGDLTAKFMKGDREMTRALNDDKTVTAVDGSELTLPGRSVLFARNVGIHMFTDAVTTADGQAIPEGMLDAMVSCLASKHDIIDNNRLKNSRKGSIYIVKPKLHGPEEVAFTDQMFSQIEQALGLPSNTVKLGIMDEERRTTVNLKECIRAARHRVVFTNTGFLDRTGDDIHTVMEAGPMLPKPEIKGAAWIKAYEDWNVDIGLQTGMRGQAQIGKGMWPMPDAMKAMVEAKIEHPLAGANTAWVPSPTAATLHALHYHKIDVAEQQQQLAQRQRASLDDILTPALLDRTLTEAEISKELDNNAQGTLGYVARWIGQGIGCSKVPDINDIGLMEDRATLRISSQHLANWLHHGIASKEQVMASLKKMAKVVDQQNEGDPNYRPMATDFDNSIEFQAAVDLVFDGYEEPNGYTEPALHRRRREAKQAAS